MVAKAEAKKREPWEQELESKKEVTCSTDFVKRVVSTQ